MYKCLKVKNAGKIFSVFFLIFIISYLFTTVNGAEDSKKHEGILLPVIMYHAVYTDISVYPDYIITPDTLESDMKYLKDNGYTAILTEDLINYIDNNVPLPEKPIMITFDDGYYNNLYYALPILQKYDMKAVISVVGIFSDTLAHNDPGIPSYSYLTWDNINTLIESGIIEIGNHTYQFHSCKNRKGCTRLAGESEEDYQRILMSDLEKLQDLLRINCGMVPISFAYPYGSICRESIPVLKVMGFRCTFNCYEKPNYITRDPDCLFSLNRYNRSNSVSTNQFMKQALSG